MNWIGILFLIGGVVVMIFGILSLVEYSKYLALQREQKLLDEREPLYDYTGRLTKEGHWDGKVFIGKYSPNEIEEGHNSVAIGWHAGTTLVDVK